LSADEGLGILILFSVVGGIILGELRSRKSKPKTVDKKVKHRKKRKIEDDLSLEDSEFDGAILFGDYWFPPECFDDIENN
jgi:hypothetical protein